MTLIQDVVIKPLKVIADERGYLMEMLRVDDPLFKSFGQVYCSVAYPGVVKGWHYHKVQWDNFVIVSGMMKVVLYDMRDGSPTKGEVNEFFMGEKNPVLLRIPPGVAHGMKGMEPMGGMLINTPSHPYHYTEPDEFRIHPHDNDIPYDWSRKDG
jgi:dTDP-4-dehydrorhamnose 3,5-epimerase